MVTETAALDAGMKALADGTRRGILGLLRQGQRSVLEIAEEFPMSRPAISKHLRILKEAGLVLETPAGRQRLYELETGPLTAVMTWLSGFNGGDGAARPGSRRRRAERPVRAASTAASDWRVW